MPVNQYKKIERDFAVRVGALSRRTSASLGNHFTSIVAKGKERFTVMLIPLSEKKILNFQISFFILIFATVTLGIILVGSVLLALNYTYLSEQNVKLAKSVDVYSKTLSSLKDQIAEIRTAGRSLKASVDDVLTAAENRGGAPLLGVNPVAASFPVAPEDRANGNSTLADLRTVTALVQTSSDSLDQVRRKLDLFQDFFASTPATWPLKGGAGIITTRFGWATNPFSKIGYMHTGVDIAWSYGTPVLATADGKVVQAGWGDDLGNHVVIQHKYGFSTRYSHLSQILKYKGATVRRGDVIGLLGSTGLSTGPHVDYVVRLGLQYINPMPFLSIKRANTVALSGMSSD